MSHLQNLWSKYNFSKPDHGEKCLDVGGQVEVEQEVVLHILQQFEAVSIPWNKINIFWTKINGKTMSQSNKSTEGTCYRRNIVAPRVAEVLVPKRAWIEWSWSPEVRDKLIITIMPGSAHKPASTAQFCRRWRGLWDRRRWRRCWGTWGPGTRSGPARLRGTV